MLSNIISNSTETHSFFVMKKGIGFTCGMLSALAAALSAFALSRIVYPKNGKSTSSIFIIVLKLFMATSISDVIYSLNNTLTWSDWDPKSIACLARGVWFQIGFQSSFFFTACTAYELYNMITTTMKDSNFSMSDNNNNNIPDSSRNYPGQKNVSRFQLYLFINICLVIVSVLTIGSNQGFGPASDTNEHTLCWVLTTRWTALVAMVRSKLKNEM